MGMHLDIGGNERVVNPTERQVRDAVDGLDERGDTFSVALSRDDGAFMHAFGGPSAFFLTYRAPDKDRQFASGIPLDKDVACSLLTAFLRRDPSYVDTIYWFDVTGRAPDMSRRAKAFLTALVVVVAVLVVAAIVQCLRYGINWR